jgi:hypothetical protein
MFSSSPSRDTNTNYTTLGPIPDYHTPIFSDSHFQGFDDSIHQGSEQITPTTPHDQTTQFYHPYTGYYYGLINLS